MESAFRPITAILYDDGPAFEGFLEEATGAMARAGLRLAGLVQRSVPRTGRRKCDMMLRDLATGALHPISQDLGPEARGCRLDQDLLLKACVAAEAGLTDETSLLVLSKFGKTEVEGGGVRDLVAAALDRSVPILIGVPVINREPFESFAGDCARCLRLETLSAASLIEFVPGMAI